MNQFSPSYSSLRLQTDFPMTGFSRPTTITEHCEAVERAIQIMHERLDEPLTLGALSRVACISQYHFNRVFRQITGIPPCQFLYALRLETAKRLLLTTHESVTDVCFEVGYNSLGTFTRRFVERSGVSPGRFRLVAQSSIENRLEKLLKAVSASQVSTDPSLSGEVKAPADFNGLIFIGLFKTPIPQGEPIAGTVVSRPGPYSLGSVADGAYYLLAAGLARSDDPKDYFLYESALRGGGQLIQAHHGEILGETTISLRPPETLDPPILLTLPLLKARAYS